MKKIFFKAIGIIALCSVTAGCIKETLPEGATQTKKQVAESTFALEGILRGLPAAMMTSGWSGYYSTYEWHTDFGMPAIHLFTEYMLNDLATMGDEPLYNRFYQSAMNSGQDARYAVTAYYWDLYYKWIKIANDLIVVVDPSSANSVQKAYLGQALAYRAAFYLDLARLYSPKEVTDPYALGEGYKIPDAIKDLTVPIITDKTDEAAARNNPRATRKEMYEFILKDLSDAEEYLKGQTFSYTVPSLTLVYGLKARAYIEMGYWSETPKEDFKQAIKYAGLAITEGGRTPLTKDQWQDPTNGFNNGASNSAWIWGQTLASENQGNIITFTAHLSNEAAWGYAVVAQIGADRRFYESINDTDWRKASWLSPEFIANPEAEEFADVYKFSGGASGRKGFIYGTSENPAAKAYESIKFRPAQGNVSDYNVGNCADHCLMRIEEMYFILAEATAQVEGLSQGKQKLEEFVQKYRDPEFKCGANSLENFLVDDLLYQKRIEFWGEGILICDYKRLNGGIERGYSGTNQAPAYRFNCTGRSPQWNIVITRGEYQSNTGVTEDLNNPDPTDKIEQWLE